MSVYEHMQADWKAAFKAREKIKKDILSFVIAQIKNKQIDSKEDLTDTEVIKLIQKEIKTREEAIRLNEQVGNTEEVDLEKTRIQHLQVYLPTMLTQEELTAIVTAFVSEHNIEEPGKQRGQIIGPIMKEHGAQVDGGLLNKIISSMS